MFSDLSWVRAKKLTMHDLNPINNRSLCLLLVSLFKNRRKLVLCIQKISISFQCKKQFLPPSNSPSNIQSILYLNSRPTSRGKTNQSWCFLWWLISKCGSKTSEVSSLGSQSCCNKPFRWGRNLTLKGSSETSSPAVRSEGCSPGRSLLDLENGQRFPEATESTCCSWGWAPPSLQGLQSRQIQRTRAHYYSNWASSNVSNIWAIQTNFQCCSSTTLKRKLVLRF